jgi:hypothetical protein
MTRGGTGTPRRAARIALAFLVATAAADGRADTWSLLLEPRFQWLDQTTTDQAGATNRSEQYALGQRYALTLSKSLYPTFTINAGGAFEDDRGWLTTNGTRSRTDAWRSDGYGRLALGGSVLNGSAGYERSDEAQRTFGIPASPREVNEVWSGRLLWNPADLPSLFLQLTRTHLYDASRLVTDQTTADALLSARYRGIPAVDLEYSLRYTNPVDRISETETTAVVQALHATWNDKLFNGRTLAYVSANALQRTTTTVSTGAAGTVSTQQFPVAGYSLVEAFPATPELDTLVLNPALVNGDLTGTASLNIGFGVPAGDTANRDIGAQFQDVLTRVNRVHVWVNKTLPPQVSSAYAWAAYQSDDNVHWTPVPLAGPVVFADFQNRFEIPIADVQARFVKVIVRPLAPAVTVDPRYSEVLVTEIQFFLVVPAAQVVGRATDDVESVSATAQTRILSVPSVSWDLGIFTSRSARAARPTYSILNGLSLAHVFDPVWSVSARVQRQDVDSGAGHVGGFQWNGGIAAKPLPTLRHGFVYAGSWSETPRGTTLSQSVNLVNHADLYRGASLQATGTAADSTGDTGQNTKSVNVSASASLAPNTMVSSSATYLYGHTWQSAPGFPSTQSIDERILASLSLAPVQALFLSGSVTRVIHGARPTTLASGTAALSPFPGGALQIRIAYTESVDTAADAKVRTFVPGLHWNVRPGVILDASYSWIANDAAAARSRTRAALVILTIAI